MMLKGPHLTRLLGGVSLAAFLIALLRLISTASPSPAGSSSVSESPSPVARSRPTSAEIRAQAIRDTIEAVRQECQRNAAGDWDRWIEQLGPFRANLLERIRKVKPYNPKAEGWFEARSAVLEGKGGFPLFEPAPEHYLSYIYDPKTLDEFRAGRPVVAAARWLKSRGIDIIFVPVPKMTEIYPEHFADHCPSDRIVAPQLRRILLELLESDVEVVDLLPLLLREKDKESALLYQPADPHWGPAAWTLAARAVAVRLKRYDFVASALAGPRACQPAESPFPPANQGAAYLALTPDQRRRAEASQPRSLPSVQNCIRPLHDPTSPVIVVGDSYNGGFWELLSQETNLPINQLSGGGHTTHALKDFLRDPESLGDCRVVVWLVCNTGLTAPWPLPRAIQQCGLARINHGLHTECSGSSSFLAEACFSPAVFSRK